MCCIFSVDPRVFGRYCSQDAGDGDTKIYECHHRMCSEYFLGVMHHIPLCKKPAKQHQRKKVNENQSRAQCSYIDRGQERVGQVDFKGNPVNWVEDFPINKYWDLPKNFDKNDVETEDSWKERSVKKKAFWSFPPIPPQPERLQEPPRGTYYAEVRGSEIDCIEKVQPIEGTGDHDFTKVSVLEVKIEIPSFRYIDYENQARADKNFNYRVLRQKFIKDKPGTQYRHDYDSFGCYAYLSRKWHRGIESIHVYNYGKYRCPRKNEWHLFEKHEHDYNY